MARALQRHCKSVGSILAGGQGRTGPQGYREISQCAPRIFAPWRRIFKKNEYCEGNNKMYMLK